MQHWGKQQERKKEVYEEEYGGVMGLLIQAVESKEIQRSAWLPEKKINKKRIKNYNS